MLPFDASILSYIFVQRQEQGYLQVKPSRSEASSDCTPDVLLLSQFGGSGLTATEVDIMTTDEPENGGLSESMFWPHITCLDVSSCQDSICFNIFSKLFFGRCYCKQWHV